MFGFFKKKKALLNSSDVIKEGWVIKEPKVKKKSRDRWCVLTMKNICTFKKEKNYTSPKEVFNIDRIKTIKSDSDASSGIFIIEIFSGGIFEFKADSLEEKVAWLSNIGKIMVQQSKPGIFLSEEE